MSLKQLEEAIKNRPPDYALGQKGIKWFEDFTKKFNAFKITHVVIPRKQLREIQEKHTTRNKAGTVIWEDIVNIVHFIDKLLELGDEK